MTARARDMPAAVPATRDDAPSLSAVYRREFGFVWRTLRYFGIPAEAVEDLAQEVFIVAHRRLDDYDPERGPIRAWLYGIVRNTALRHHRSARRHDPRRLEESPEVVGLGVDPRADPEARVARAQAARVVERCLASITPERREVFVLSDVEGLSAPAIAELLGVKLGTVYSRLGRARSEFRKAAARHLARDRRHHDG